MAPLVETRSAEQESRRARGSRGGLGAPDDGGSVVREYGNGAFPYVPVVSQGASMCDGSRQLEVRIGYGARRVGCGDQCPLYLWWEWSSPYVWRVLWVVWVWGRKPDPAPPGS